MSLFDTPTGKRKKLKFNPRPPMPETTWKKDNYFPDLSGAKAISFDVETKDPDLLDYGAGWGRNRGHIIGIALGTDDGFQHYYPMRHEDEAHDNYDPRQVLAYAKAQLSRAHQRKVGHNTIYDVGWLAHEGVPVVGKIFDTFLASKIIDFQEPASLEAVAQRCGFKGKASEELYKWLFEYYGQTALPKSDRDYRKTAASNFYRCPPRLIGTYAESDVRIPIQAGAIQYDIMKRAGLTTVFDLECRLVPVLVAMRMKGVTVDVDAAEKAYDSISGEIETIQKNIDRTVGRRGVNTGAPSEMEGVFKKLGVDPVRTAKGAVSLSEGSLKSMRHPIVKDMITIAELKKYNSTFIQNAILNSNVDGILYAEFDQMGAKTGRFSGRNPNLQQVPSKNELAKMVRRIFVPHEGDRFWRKYDYASIENRIFAEFAVGEAGSKLRQQYIDDPSTDYHNWCLELVAPFAGWIIDTVAKYAAKRKPIKNINFGIVYGMGVDKLAASLGISFKEASVLMEAYHKALPHVKDTMDYLSAQADRMGYSETILGRKVKFDMWEPNEWSSVPRPPMKRNIALSCYGFNIRKAGLYKATNYTIQGSAADLMKKAMVDCYEMGIFDATGIPVMTVHDELNFTENGGQDDAFLEMVNVMETAIPMRVPISVDGEIGKNWSDLKDIT